MRYLQIDSVEPIQFPSNCICCGNQTKGNLSVDPTTGGEDGEFALGCLLGIFPPPVGLLVNYFMAHDKRKRRLTIPICGRCRLNLLLPPLGALLPLAVTATFLGFTIYAWAVERWSLSGLTMAGFLVSMFWAMIVVGAKKGGSLPLQVSFEGTSLRYKIFADSVYFEAWAEMSGAVIKSR